MCVTPWVMFSWFQPDSACAVSVPAPAVSARTTEASFSRIIVNVPCSAPTPERCAFSQEANPLRRAPTLAPGGRFVHAADETLQAQRQSASLLFCEEAAQFAPP